MFKLKDETWINPDAVESVYAHSGEVRVVMREDVGENYFYVRCDSPEQAVAVAEKLAEAIEAGTTRDRLNCLVNKMFDIIDMLRNRL